MIPAIITQDSLFERAVSILPVHEYNILKAYVESGKHELSTETSTKFFELYLNGTSCSEIHRINKAFPYEAILWARLKYSWDEQKGEYLQDLQERAREKVLKAQLESTELVSDMILVANKRYGDKFKKYLQTGDEAHLSGLNGMNLENLGALVKAVEGLLKATGQSNTVNVKTKSEQTVNLNVTSNSQDGLSPEAAAQVLKIMADDKRNK